MLFIFGDLKKKYIKIYILKLYEYIYTYIFIQKYIRKYKIYIHILPLQKKCKHWIIKEHQILAKNKMCEIIIKKKNWSEYFPQKKTLQQKY